MKIEYISEFIALAELNNYTLAAQKLFITQPALSRHMTALEESIGAKLIQRSTHDVKLTENGHKAHEAFKEIINIYDSLARDIYNSNNEDFTDFVVDYVRVYQSPEIDALVAGR